CDRQGLIGREMFAIDGVKLPANASKAKSGTRADYQRQLDRMELATTQSVGRVRCGVCTVTRRFTVSVGLRYANPTYKPNYV
ncbi:MAG: hypothetical protein HY272_00315, partial [Gammaproteobacteria bacterium]|nr:hypothetical protein [Gammaproteobacteria bacterium]